MPTPSTRSPIRIARGTIANLNTSIADILDGEICWATDEDKIYVKDGGSLVATMLTTAEIGVTVQAYDVDTAKYDDTTANFTGTLQNGGSDVVVDTDIGVTVQGYDADTAKLDVTQTFTAPQTFNAGASDSKGDLRTIPENSQASTYTLVASDSGKYVISVSGNSVTVPSGVFSSGEAVSIYNNSTSTLSIVEGASVTLRKAGTATTGSRTLAQYGLGTVLCVGTDTFIIVGVGVS